MNRTTTAIAAIPSGRLYHGGFGCRAGSGCWRVAAVATRTRSRVVKVTSSPRLSVVDRRVGGHARGLQRVGDPVAARRREAGDPERLENRVNRQRGTPAAPAEVLRDLACGR